MFWRRVLGRGTARLRCFLSSAASTSSSPLPYVLFRADCPCLKRGPTGVCLQPSFCGTALECCQRSPSVVKPGYDGTCGSLWLAVVSCGCGVFQHSSRTCLIRNPSLSSPSFAFFMRGKKGLVPGGQALGVLLLASVGERLS